MKWCCHVFIVDEMAWWPVVGVDVLTEVAFVKVGVGSYADTS
jgi:hypothetical protein